MLKTKISLAILTLVSFVIPADASDFTLQSIHKKIAADHNQIRHLSRTEFQKLSNLSGQKNLLIFDVRETEEFKVSHLKNAKHLSPSTWASTFLKKYGKDVKGKNILFYCSVGVRSSKMASYLKDELKKAGAGEIYNLKEGLFGWANEKRTMVNDQGRTDYIHPYNTHWGKLVTSDEIKRYE